MYVPRDKFRATFADFGLLAPQFLLTAMEYRRYFSALAIGNLGRGEGFPFARVTPSQHFVASLRFAGIPVRVLTGAVMAKRCFDIFFSLGLILLSTPLMVLIAGIIKLTSPGPILYRGVRIGRDGKPFRMCKFRSMIIDAERRGGSSSGDDDPRITRIGRVLRRFKLDELPQMFNVLSGEMSLVGPRPQVAHDVEKYTAEERAILAVRPGITDWATIWNSDEGAVLAGAADPDQAYIELIRPTKLRLQLEYVRQASLATDLAILAHTLIRLVFRSWIPAAIRGCPQLRSAGCQSNSSSMRATQVNFRQEPCDAQPA